MESYHFSLLVLLCFGVHMSSSEILHRQKRNWIIDSFVIDEGYQGPFPYSLGKIETEKTINLFKIHGQGVDEEPRGILEIDEQTAEITVLGPVDHEKYKVLKLMFQAIDRNKNVIDTQLGIEIKIKDSNDNAPKFERGSYSISIKEHTLQDSDVITVKATDDDSTKEYKSIKYRIVSVAPESQDLQFYLTQGLDSQTGSISFKGCLDHERAEKYRIIVEASDQGQPKPLSSSCTITINIEDGNNHMPVITKQTGPGKVKEGQENVLVSRLQVTDADTKGTAAWRAKYHIKGDTENNFKITTDPETNEGLLYVDKHLSFEDGPIRNITITVENEIPYFTCKVVDRSVWKVETIGGELYSGASISGGTPGVVSGSQQTSSHVVTVTVEDVNEAPVFDKPNKDAVLVENAEAGQYLETFTARDPDVASANTFKYVKGEDPADWISVDPNTGKVTTTKIIDRESDFVKDGAYAVTIYAVDDGNPSMTSTATLTVRIADQNDNTPSLVVSTLDICQSDKPSLANITASDRDGDPFGGPFRFMLHGDVKGKWKVEPAQGYSVNLVKDNTVHSGLYELLLEVSDLQGETAFHKLTVTVCNCVDVTRPNCRLRQLPGTTAGGSALGIVFFSLLLFAGLLLLTFLMTCKREKVPMPPDSSGQYLMVHNTEEQGTDCAVNFEPSKGGHNGTRIQTTCQSSVMNSPITVPPAVSLGQSGKYAMSQNNTMQQEQRQNLQWLVTDSVSEGLQSQSGYLQSQGKSSMETAFPRRNYKYRTIHTSSSAREMMQQRNSMHKLVTGSENEGLQANSGYLKGNSSMGTSFSRGNYKYASMGSSAMSMRQWRKSLHESLDGYNLQNIGTQINKKLYILEAPGEELGDYEPHQYVEEGDEEHSFELDAISIPDAPFDPDLGLDFRFSDLASVCMPGDSTVYSTNCETATVTQEWKTIKMNTPSHL
ncbi:cadherin-like protein 26 [Acanthochromis polyacanthus]|uniref:cadherin-like protein 26 n=1 Tax=Acanthochromis polyacanthus TaxID=80966 RepID=UPI0022343023|nr:cadherin-like protein 26 [Acanthochromis polyacanthus]